MSLDKRLKPAMPHCGDGRDDAESRPRGVSRAIKSKLAAKARRDQESVELANVCEVLPFNMSSLNKLDKSSIIRLAITYIQMKTWIQTAIVQKGNAISSLQADEGDDRKSHKSKTGGELVCQNSLNTRVHASQPQVEEGQMMLETLQGFVMFVKKNCTILYVSDTVEQHLGLKQENLLGTSVVHIIHPEDMVELSKQFKVSVSNRTADDASANVQNILQSEQKCSFLVRMKFQFSRNDERSRQSGYMLVQWTGRLRLRPSRRACGYAIEGLVCMCQPLQTNSILEIRMGGSMFISRHDLGMKFTYCDPRIITLIGYDPSEVIGKTAYYFHNPLDAPKISDCHSNLIVKGTSVSKYYRFFGKTGDWVWLQTRANLIYNTCQKPQYVVCMNYVIGEEEGQRNLRMEEEQLGFRDPNVRGCIDLANTSTESPVSICSSSGDEGHDDTGYSSGYSHTTDTSSPHTSGFVNLSSPDSHTQPECGDDRDSVLDYPMTDVSQIENLQKETSDPVSQAVTAMSNALDPFLSSFREELGLEGAQADDGMDLLDDLLKSMEEEDPVSPQPPPALPSVPNNPPVNLSEPGRHKSLLRSLLDRGDKSQTKSTMDYTFSSSGPVLKDAVLFSTSSLTSVQSDKTINTMSRSTIPFTSSDFQTQTPILQISNPNSVISDPLAGSIDSSSVSVPQPDPFIPEDLLDFAMQYCDTIPDEQSQAIITSYGQDLWCSGVDDLITTFADVQQSTTEPVKSSAVNTSPAKGPSTEGPQASPEESFIDLDNCCRKEQNTIACMQNQCQNKQSSTDVSKDLSTQILFNVLSNRNTSQIKDSRSNKSVFIQPLKATPRPVVSHTVSSSHVNGPFTSRCAVSSESERCQKLTFRTVPTQPPRLPCRTVGSPVGRGQTATVSAACVSPRCGKSLVSALCDRGAASPSSCSSKSSTPVVPSHQPTQTPSSRHSEQVTAKPSEGMSELEKYLRGYIKRPHADKTTECISPPQQSASPPAQTPFLQKLLTGELSREHYREIDSQMLKQEKQRRSSTHSLSEG